MKFLVFLVLFSALSIAFCDSWVDLSASDIDNFEVNHALNFGASNITQDAISKGHIPNGTYHVSAIESVQKKVDDDDNHDNDNDDNDGHNDDNGEDTDHHDDWDNDYRFFLEVNNGQGSGWTANYTVHVAAKTVNGDIVYAFTVSDFVYNWFANLNQGGFGENEFEWVYEDEWNEFTPAKDGVEVGGAGSDDSDEADDQVLVVPEDGGEAHWADASTVGGN